MTTHTKLLLSAMLGAAWAWAGCSVGSLIDGSLTDRAEGVGPVVARYALTAEDGNALPCCAVDSSAVRITVVGGALTFHGPADYHDTVYTPGGPMSAACVHGVPSGANVNSFTHIVTLPDGTSYLQLPCDRGSYTLVVMRRLENTDGSSTTDSVAISSGTFTASPDHVHLVDSGNARGFTTTVSGATLVVASSAHQYRFEAQH